MRPMDLLGGIPFSYCEIARNWVACLDVTVLILLLCEGMMVLQVTWLFPSGEAILGTYILWTWKPADEDCSLVLTTSRGHVTMAPTVPAILNKYPNYQQYTKWFLKTGSTAYSTKIEDVNINRKFSIKLNKTTFKKPPSSHEQILKFSRNLDIVWLFLISPLRAIQLRRCGFGTNLAAQYIQTTMIIWDWQRVNTIASCRCVAWC